MISTKPTTTARNSIIIMKKEKRTSPIGRTRMNLIILIYLYLLILPLDSISSSSFNKNDANILEDQTTKISYQDHAKNIDQVTANYSPSPIRVARATFLRLFDSTNLFSSSSSKTKIIVPPNDNNQAAEDDRNNPYQRRSIIGAISDWQRRPTQTHSANGTQVGGNGDHHQRRHSLALKQPGKLLIKRSHNLIQRDTPESLPLLQVSRIANEGK